MDGTCKESRRGWSEGNYRVFHEAEQGSQLAARFWDDMEHGSTDNGRRRKTVMKEEKRGALPGASWWREMQFETTDLQTSKKKRSLLIVLIGGNCKASSSVQKRKCVSKGTARHCNTWQLSLFVLGISTIFLYRHRGFDRIISGFNIEGRQENLVSLLLVNCSFGCLHM